MGLIDLTKESAIRLRLGASWCLGRSADGAQLTARTPEGHEIALADYSAHYEEANRRLATGSPLATLRDCVAETGGAQQAVTYLFILQQSLRHGLIEFLLVDGDSEQAVLVPQWRDYVPTLARRLPPAGSRLHRFACLRDGGAEWLLESPLCGARLRLPNLAALEAPLVRRALAGCGFLDDAPGPESDARRDALAQWEFHDLLFHVRHRGGWHRDPVGAAPAFRGKIAPLPAERPAWPGEAIELPRADDTGGAESFARLLQRRRSHRRYDESRPISLSDLGTLLDRCARVRPVQSHAADEGSGDAVFPNAARRPYPSGGASYELEIYPIVNRCDGLDPGAYHYDAVRHALVRITGRTAEVEEMIADAKKGTGGQADPQVLFAIAARFPRVMWAYRSIAYGLILRNTGVLYQTLYLAAADLGLAPCAVGSGDSAVFARLTGLDPFVEGTVGEFILGGRPLGPSALLMPSG